LARFVLPYRSNELIADRGRCGLSGSVLIVDDEQLLARILSSVLAEEGYRISVAGSAEQADPQVFGENPFDLVLLDNRLPRESGVDLVKRLRARSVRSKVILMTAYETPDVKTQVKRLEVDGYLRKPFDLTVLVNEIRDLIGPARRPGGERSVQREGR
jgi:DNA-binding response OmpR family regulator